MADQTTVAENEPPGAGVPTAEKRSFGASLLVFLERRSLVMLALGFASGLPNLLIFDTLSAWLREAGLSLEVIGFFSLATLAYSFKFLWAPLIDRTTIPGLTKLVGHRRSWMLVTQALVIVGLWLIAGGDPARNLGLMAVFAVFTGFSAATQDIVIDAWRIEAAESSKQGAMAASYQWGYRLAMITAGAAPLLLAETYGWNLSYAVMACLMGVGVAGVLFAPRETQHIVRPIHAEGVAASPVLEVVEWLVRLALFAIGALVLGSGLAGDISVIANLFGGAEGGGLGRTLTELWAAKPWNVFAQFGAVVLGGFIIFLAARPIPGARTRPGIYLGAALGEPLENFFGRYGKVAGLILALICLYRVSDFVLNIMNPFYLDLGFSKVEVAEVRKVFGVFMSVIGVFFGGLAVARLGLMRALILGAFAGPISNLAFAWLATQGPSLTALTIAIGIDNIASGLSGTCLIAYMSSLTAAGFTATQYALFSSLYALPGKLIASQSGRIVEGSAHSAEGGGFVAPLKALFTGLPDGALADGAAKVQVSPVALGAGYMTFFIYSTLIGIAAIVLVFMVARRQTEAEAQAGRA
jgi:MFS transporter, PAT family, beta-lactamase induction signal transducer AmpG